MVHIRPGGIAPREPDHVEHDTSPRDRLFPRLDRMIIHGIVRNQLPLVPLRAPRPTARTGSPIRREFGTPHNIAPERPPGSRCEPSEPSSRSALYSGAMEGL